MVVVVIVVVVVVVVVASQVATVDFMVQDELPSTAYPELRVV